MHLLGKLSGLVRPFYHKGATAQTMLIRIVNLTGLLSRRANARTCPTLIVYFEFSGRIPVQPVTSDESSDTGRSFRITEKLARSSSDFMISTVICWSAFATSTYSTSPYPTKLSV